MSIEIKEPKTSDNDTLKHCDLFRWADEKDGICILFIKSQLNESYYLASLENPNKTWSRDKRIFLSWIAEGKLVRVPKGTQVIITQD